MTERRAGRPRAASEDLSATLSGEGASTPPPGAASTGGAEEAPPAAPAARAPVGAAGARRLSVLVELRVPRADLGASAVSMAAGLPGTFDVDPAYPPVEIRSRGPAMGPVPPDEGIVTIRGRVTEDEMAALRAHPRVRDAWLDVTLAHFRAEPDDAWRRFVRPGPVGAFGPCPIGQCDCQPTQAGGDMEDVRRKLGVEQIWSAGYRGSGIVIGIVDGGITARGRSDAPRLIDRVRDGWPAADWGTRADWGGHGNMTATDALGMAPEAEVYDLRIASSSIAGVISDALAAFEWAIAHHRRDGTPHILSNSWGIFQQNWDPRYAQDPDHPFTRKVVDALDEGILVLFAAGNCGGTCPDQRCGADNGPGRSIWGANGHPRVITVGAVNLTDQLVGYSSEGPAKLENPAAPEKPDFCSITHFAGFFPSDSGTSAATPVAAGVVALLKQAKPGATQDELRATLRATTRDIGPAGWDPHSGAGILQAKAAFDRIAPTGPGPGPADPWERLERLLQDAIVLLRTQAVAGQSTEAARFDAVLTRAAVDRAYRERLQTAPRVALTEAGIALRPGERVSVLEYNEGERFLFLPPLAAEPWAGSGDVRFGVNWAGVVCTLSHHAVGVLVSAQDIASSLLQLVGRVVPPPYSLAVRVIALYISAHRQLVQAVDRGRGVYLTLPWPAIWFGQFWLVVPTSR